MGKSPNVRFDQKIRFKPEYPYVIVCEGMDEYSFLLSYLKHLEKNEQERFIDCHNVVDFGGINDMNKLLNDIKQLPKYDEMKAFLIVRDAERDADAAVKSLQLQIKRTWNVDIDNTGAIQTTDDGMKVGFFLLPGFDEQGNFLNGTLEDLCLGIIDDSLNENSILQCVDKYMCDIEQRRDKPWIWPHKNRLHLYFSSTDEFVGDKLGEATKKGAFDLSSPRLSHLKEMIFQMQGDT